MKIGKKLYETRENNEENNMKYTKKEQTKNKFKSFLFSLAKKFLFLLQINKKKTKIKSAVIKDMDITQILRKLKEMEIFKNLFLNNDQKILLNFASKPRIEEELNMKSPNDLEFKRKILQKNIFPSKKFCNSHERNSLYSLVSKAYNNLLDSKDEFNSKIINIIDNDSIKKLNNSEQNTKSKMSFFKKSHFDK